MKILGTVKEIQELQNRCMVIECDDCILCNAGICGVYETMQYMEELNRIDPELETTLVI